VQGASQTLSAGKLEAHLVDVAPDNSEKVIAETANAVNVGTDPSVPKKTIAAILVPEARTVAPGHRLGLHIGVLHSQNTVADKLYYDSDEFPTSVTVTTGDIAQGRTPCAAVQGAVVTRPSVRAAGRRQLPATGAPFGEAAALALGVTALITSRARRRFRTGP
jgi:hypothetical protein